MIDSKLTCENCKYRVENECRFNPPAVVVCSSSIVKTFYPIVHYPKFEGSRYTPFSPESWEKACAKFEQGDLKNVKKNIH